MIGCGCLKYRTLVWTNHHISARNNAVDAFAKGKAISAKRNQPLVTPTTFEQAVIGWDGDLSRLRWGKANAGPSDQSRGCPLRPGEIELRNGNDCSLSRIVYRYADTWTYATGELDVVILHGSVT